MNLSAPFIRRPVATTLLTIGLALSGILAFRMLPVAALPQVTLSWPNTATGFYLDRASTLSGVLLWTPLLLISNQTSLVVSTTNGQCFYRLRNP